MIFITELIQVGLGQESSKAIVTSNTINNAGGISINSDKNSYAQVKSNSIDSSYYNGLELYRVSGIIEANTITNAGKMGRLWNLSKLGFQLPSN